MIKTFCKLFYNNFLSICYDTQKNSQDDIIIDFNKYDNINIDYKIQKKTDFYNGDFIENDLFNNKKKNLLNTHTFIENTDNTNLIDKDIFENDLLNTHTFIENTDNTNLIDKDIFENDLLNTNIFIEDNDTTNLIDKDIFENDLLNTNIFIEDNDTTNLIDKDIFENNLSDIHNENSYDDCKSKDDYSDIDDKYDKISDID